MCCAAAHAGTPRAFWRSVVLVVGHHDDWDVLALAQAGHRHTAREHLLQAARRSEATCVCQSLTPQHEANPCRVDCCIPIRHRSHLAQLPAHAVWITNTLSQAPLYIWLARAKA